MIYTDKGKPATVIRIATPQDVADKKLDPGVYRASRSPGNVTVLCGLNGSFETVLCNIAEMRADNPLELSEVMNTILADPRGG